MQADLLSPPYNFAVVQLPERNYPGVVVQGDTFNSLLRQVERIQGLLNAKELEELADEIEDLRGLLSDVLSNYERVCADRGRDLPYPQRPPT